MTTLQKQIHQGGDWQVKNPDTTPGGWAFEFANDHYPDIDDSAEVLIAILHTTLADCDRDTKARSLEVGKKWLLSMVIIFLTGSTLKKMVVNFG